MMSNAARQPEQGKQTRASVLTSPGHGAIACVAVQGPAAADVVATCFEPAGNSRLSDRTIRFGRWRSNGEELVVAHRSDDSKEVHCHGGDAAVRRVVQDLCDAGCVAVPARQLHSSNPLDHLAMVALSHARTQRAAKLLLGQYQGDLDRGVRDLLGCVERNELAQAMSDLEQIEQWAFWGERLLSPWVVAIVGRPNVGKSSLMNCLLGYERSIVLDQPGTTRDVVTMATAVDGWVVELADTAGVRCTSDELELQGIQRAKRLVESSDAVLMVADCSQDFDVQDRQIYGLAEEALAERLMVVHNKCDLNTDPSWKLGRPDGVVISCKTGDGIDELLSDLHDLLTPPFDAPLVICTAPAMTAAFRAVAEACCADNRSLAIRILQDLVAGQFEGRNLVESLQQGVRA